MQTKVCDRSGKRHVELMTIDTVLRAHTRGGTARLYPSVAAVYFIASICISFEEVSVTTVTLNPCACEGMV